MVNRRIRLTDIQHVKLNILSAYLDCSTSELISQAIDLYTARQAAGQRYIQATFDYLDRGELPASGDAK